MYSLDYKIYLNNFNSVMSDALNCLDAVRETLIGKEVDVDDFNSKATMVVDDVFMKHDEPHQLMVKIAVKEYKAAKFIVPIEHIFVMEKNDV